MWSEEGEQEGHPLTLISKGDNPAMLVNRKQRCLQRQLHDEVWIVHYSCQCQSYCAGCEPAIGGNCLSDNFIASENGDIYFFSPEQLDGSRGIPNQENLYVYRNGQVQYVTTFTGGAFCFKTSAYRHRCSDTPIVRMQVSPDDSHMAFVTASPVTQYNNAGYLEMYTYEPVHP